MSRLEALNDFIQSDMATFKKICRKLLKMTFIVKEKNEEHRKDFAFIKKHTDIFSEYFSIIGYDVICDSEAGVARLANLASAGEEGRIQSNRKRLRLQESIVLSALWLKYEEMIVNGGLTNAVVISKSELDFQLEKLGAKNKIDKTSMINILKLFETFNLIEVIGQVGEVDCQLRMFTSMQFCLSETAFKNMAESSAAKMKEKSEEIDSIGYAASEDDEDDE